MTTLTQALQSHPLLDGVPEYELATLAGQVDRFLLDPGAILCEQGAPSTACYLVVSGEVEARTVESSDTSAPPQRRFYENDVVGDVAVLEGFPYRATVRAVTTSHVIAVPAPQFRRLVGKYSLLRNRIARPPSSEATHNAVFTLPNLRADEQIIEQSRKHWIVVAYALFLPVALLLGLALLTAVAIAYQPAWLIGLSRTWRVGGLLLVTLFLVSWIIWEYLDWMNDLHIVTTHRIIHIQKMAFFFEERHETPIEKVQDVSLQKYNPLNELLDYGDLFIGTASQNGQMIFRYVPRPAELQGHILEVKDDFESRMKRREAFQKRRTITEALSPGDEPAQNGSGPADESEEVPATNRSLFDRFAGYINVFSLHEEHSNGALLWRKHWIILLGEIKWVLGYMLLLSAGVVLALVHLQRNPTPLIGPLPLMLLIGVLGLFGLAWLFWVYDDWRNDVYILTTDAVVDEEKLPLGFEKEVRRAPLDTIQDIQYEIPNPIYTILNVGNVLIQTAGVEGQLTFSHVHRPRNIMRLIYERLRARREAQRAREQQRRDEAVAEMLVIYEELKRRQSQQPPAD